jgi:hypothetical protein
VLVVPAAALEPLGRLIRELRGPDNPYLPAKPDSPR